MKHPWLWIIGGPNGAGKTTFCMRFLPEWVKTPHYVNADLIAAGLSPLDPSLAPVEAGKVMLQKIDELIRAKKTFAVESTLSGKTFLKLARRLKAKGWKIGVAYLWLASDKIALDRVAARVLSGGHSIPRETVIRRRTRGLRSLPEYIAVADRCLLFDNSSEETRLIYSVGNSVRVDLDPSTTQRIILGAKL